MSVPVPATCACIGGNNLISGPNPILSASRERLQFQHQSHVRAAVPTAPGKFMS